MRQIGNLPAKSFDNAVADLKNTIADMVLGQMAVRPLAYARA